MGLTRETSSAHFFKSCLESVSLRIRAILELIQQARGQDELPWIVASGKALESNALWRQMVSDSSGLKVVLDSDTHEGTGRGVARLVSVALDAVGKKDASNLLFEEEIRAFTSSDPRQSARAYFDQAAANQQQFIEAMSPLFC